MIIRKQAEPVEEIVPVVVRIAAEWADQLQFHRPRIRHVVRDVEEARRQPGKGKGWRKRVPLLHEEPERVERHGALDNRPPAMFSVRPKGLKIRCPNSWMPRLSPLKMLA